LANNIKVTLKEIRFGGFNPFSVIQGFLSNLTETDAITEIFCYREVNTVKMASPKCRSGVPSLHSLCWKTEVAEQVSYVAT
jgi:hypothetical protein